MTSALDENSQALATRLQGLVLFWEGCGLQNHHSGVGFVAQMLRQEFQQIGVWPIIPSVSSKILKRLKLTTATASWVSAQRHLKSVQPTGCAIFHGLSNFNIPPWVAKDSKVKFVLTVHDIIPLSHPDVVSASLRFQMRLLMPRALEAADVVICSSQFTQSEVIRRFPSVASKTTVISLGRPPYRGKPGRFSSPSSPANHESHEQLCLLSIGRDEPYKRLDSLLAILDRLDPKFRLVIVTNADGKQRLTTVARANGLESRVRILSDVPQSELEQLFATSHIYLQPSIAEGYCLPAVDAQSLGMPVVYCDGTVLRETVGTSGIAVNNANEPDAWVAAIMEANRLLHAPQFPEITRQFVHSQNSWRQTAFQYATIYDSLVR